MRKLLSVALVGALVACHHDSSPMMMNPDGPPMMAATSIAHSNSIAISSDGNTLYVVNADLDSVSVIDAQGRTLKSEILLAAAHPAVDGSGAYTPAVMPRALALSPDGATLYVTGMRSSSLYAIDLASGAVSAPIIVGSEPVGVVVAADGSAIFVACSNDGTVVRVDATTKQVTATAQVGGEPWGLGFAPDGTLLATQFHGPGLDPIDPSTFAVGSAWAIPDTAPRGDARLAHGQVRGIYDVATRPGSQDVWALHMMLGTDTAQPTLDFEETVFPSASILVGGAYQRTLSTDAQDVPGIDGSFADVVSGPHSIAFTSDGAFALVVDTNSEDVLAINATSGTEVALLRPLPGHMPEGIVISPDDSHAYVDERNTGDIAVIDITHDDGIALAVDGAPIPRFASDPMPSQMRLGQLLFYSANSDKYPITTNHWVACASCHLEGRSDAVTWLFAQGPRDTPTNAGGMLGTGYLFRTADRNQMQDYWRTIDVEQGGAFDCTAVADGSGAPVCPTEITTYLNAIENYVDYGIPLPIPPTTDPTKVARGQQIFENVAGCAGCHSGPRFTDSGSGSPGLPLDDPSPLHDVGTCVTTGYADVDHTAIDNSPRSACMFDTPSLSGLASSPPYLHDGSAPTIMDVLEKTRGTMGDITSLSGSDEDALVEYLRSL
ncbi:MAG TPA: hypothetical protein VGL61_12560 [Kofleriaceae bacterium]|jgi:YVTN family beta-propeller protein